MAKIPLLVGILLTTALVSSATTIVIAWTPYEIVIGADSGSAMTNSNGSASIGPDVCKFGWNSRGSEFFLMQGLIRPRPPAGDFWESTKRESDITGLSVGDHAKGALEAIKPDVRKVVEAEGRERTDDYTGWLNGDPITGVVFVRFEGRPVLYSAELILYPFNPPDQQLVIVESRGFQKSAKGFLVLGIKDHIERIPRANVQRVLDSRGLERGVHQLIEEEIDGVNVREPITMLRITANGAAWIQHGLCPALPQAR